MPVVIVPEDPADEWALDEWLEEMADAKPGGPAVMSPQQMAATEVIRVPANKARSAVRQILGYSIADNDSFLLERPEVPLNHPWFRWLWADSCSVQFVNPLGNTDYEHPDSTVDNPLYQAKQASDAFVDYGPEYTGRYGTALITVQFRHYPWVVWADWDTSWEDFVGEEWRRMCVMSGMKPKLDLIAAEGTDTGKLRFAERDAAFAAGGENPTPGPAGTIFDGAVYVRKSQTSYTVCWRCVEEQYLTGAYPDDVTDGLVMPRFPRFERFLGTVNSAELFGHPKNTLLFADYWTTRYPLPVRTNYDFGLIAHDVYMVFDAFDPPRPTGVKNSAGADILDANRKRGHLVFPFRPNSSKHWFAAAAGDGTTAGTYSGAFVLEELDHTELFRHADDPNYPLP